MLVSWRKSRYEINYSHFFRGGWRGVLQWCNVRAHKIIISCLYHWLSTYPNVPVHISWLAAATFDLFLRCVWCIILLEKGKHCGVRDVTLVTHICSHLAECLYATFRNQTRYCGAPPWAGMSCETMGFYLQGQGHIVGLYNQNMTVSTIFISSKPVSLLQPNSIWV